MLATASLCLQGAHLMTWQPKSQAVPVVWLSRDNEACGGEIDTRRRTGVLAVVRRACFGSHFPGHGYARTVPWQVIEQARNRTARRA